ncbi:MAG: hypothetical protein N3G21_04590 [Candidatus Hydrogenedentes bacterium]|nr:hypothetical protein [Candidatus Hydrogenedentota bacterium]
MPRIDIDDFLTDYERAVCYFTLPKISYTVRPIVVFFYTLILLVSFSLLFVGFLYESLLLVNLGGFLSFGVALVGVSLFVGRTIVNEYKWRKYLRYSSISPNKVEIDLPDPFQNHVLFSIPLDKRFSNLFPCIDRNGEVLFFIEEIEKGRKWVIKNPQDVEVARVEGKPSLFSFVISYKTPFVMRVYEGTNLSYFIKPKCSIFNVGFVVLDKKQTPNLNYTISDTAVFVNKELVGRFYQLRRYFYLDIQEQHFNLGLLAFFIYFSG